MAIYDPERLIRCVDFEIKYEEGLKNAYSKLCGDLTIEELFTTDSVYVSARRCARGFKHKRDTQKFMQSAWLNSYELCQKILKGNFKPEYYSERVINERGKLRLIKPPKFECKVVQKVLCDYLVRPALEPRMITANYASIRGRGVSKLYNDVEKSLKKALKDDESVIVMVDFSKYFANINNDILFRELSKYIHDKGVLALIRSFSPEEYGLSLGNELSQVPASFFPSPIDHMVKDEMGIKDYFRYMDDSLAIVSLSRKDKYLTKIREKAGTLGIVINDDKIKCCEIGQPFIFCKERYLFDNRRKCYYRIQNPRIVRAEKRKLKSFKGRLDKGEMSMEKIQRQYKGVRGMISAHPNNIRKLRELDKLYFELFQELRDGE